MKPLSLLLFTFTAGALCAGGGASVTTVVPFAALEAGPGADHRKTLDEITNLINQKELARADQLCDEVLAQFQKMMTDPRTTYLAFANKAELEHFRKTNPRLHKVEWLDNVYGEVLHRKTFIAAAQMRYADALKQARYEAAYRPYAAAAQAELGYVLNKLSRHHEALEAYEKAAELSVMYASSKPSHAMSLRGMGFTLTELNRLDDAIVAFEQSLKIEPNNKLAVSELDYVRKLKQKMK